MRFGKAVVKHRILILILTAALLVPSVFGMIGTRVNYDMLTYLPEDIDTVIGQNELLKDFNKGAFTFLIFEDMPNKDVAALKQQVEQVEHVDTVLWYDSLADLSVPMELLPEKVYKAFNTDHSTMMAVFFDSAHLGGRHHGRRAADPHHLRQAVLRVRHVGSGDGSEGPVRAGGADLCGAGRGAGVRGHDAVSGRLAGPLRVPGLHRHHRSC